MPRNATEPSEPACHRDAAALLKRHHVPFKQIVAVDPDAIMYVAPGDRPAIAWITVLDGKEHVRMEPGFPAWPEDEAA